MKLNGTQYRTLFDALVSAFPRISDLEQMVSFEMGVNLPEIAYGSLADQVFKLVQWAEAQGRLEELILGARRANPGNQNLLLAAQEVGLERKG